MPSNLSMGRAAASDARYAEMEVRRNAGKAREAAKKVESENWMECGVSNTQQRLPSDVLWESGHKVLCVFTVR